MTNQESTACLLCGSRLLVEVDHLTGDTLRKLWRRGMNMALSDEAFGAVEATTIVSLYRCGECGFEFFNPQFGGSEAFYRELAHPNYYTPNRPEFLRTRDFAIRRRLRRVLDVGCGSGAFLDLAKSAGLETHGLELNTGAAEQARMKGHQIFDCLLDGMKPGQPGESYDLITLFQVLEHVPDPVRVIQDAKGRLTSGGYIAVSVPAAEGVYRLAPFDPHQWPPHHTSRWRGADFAQIARRCGLRVAQQGGDVLYGAAIEHFWALNNRMSCIVGRVPAVGGDYLPKVISMIYRALRLKHLFRNSGPSIYAFLQRS